MFRRDSLNCGTESGSEKRTQEIEIIEGVKVKVGMLDITLYRDDLSTLGYNPIVHGTDIDFDLNGKI